MVNLIAWLRVIRLFLLMFYKLTIAWRRSNTLLCGKRQGCQALANQRREAVFSRIAQNTALQAHVVLHDSMSSKRCPQRENLVEFSQAIAILYDLFLAAPGAMIHAVFSTLLSLPNLLLLYLKLRLIRYVSRTILRKE